MSECKKFDKAFIEKKIAQIIFIANNQDGFKAYKELELLLHQAKENLPGSFLLPILKLKAAILCLLHRYDEAKKFISGVTKELTQEEAFFFYLFEARLCCYLKEYQRAFDLYLLALKINLYGFSKDDIVLFTKLSSWLMTDFDIEKWNNFLVSRYGYVDEVANLLYNHYLFNSNFDLALLTRVNSLFYSCSKLDREDGIKLINRASGDFPIELKNHQLFCALVRWLTKSASALDYTEILKSKIDHSLIDYIRLEAYIKGCCDMPLSGKRIKKLEEAYKGESQFYLLMAKYYQKIGLQNQSKIFTYIDYALSFCSNQDGEAHIHQFLKENFKFTKKMLSTLLSTAELSYFAMQIKNGNKAYLPLIKEASCNGTFYFSKIASRTLNMISRYSKFLDPQ